MDYDASDLGPCKKRVQVTLDAEEVNREFDKSYAQLRSQVTLPGFRPGRAPRRVLERRFGDHVRSEVTQELLQKNIEEVIARLEITAVSPPRLVDEEEFKDGIQPDQELMFSFEVETKADFDLPEYVGVEVERILPEVKDEHIQQVLEGHARDKATWQPAETDTYAPGDQVTISLTVLDGDRPIFDEEELRISGEHPVAAGFAIADLDASLDGAKVDSTVELKVKPPAEFSFDGKSYDPEQDLDAKLEVLELKRKVIPDIDDEFAGELGFDDLEAFRQNVRDTLGKRAEQAADEGAVARILGKLVEVADIPLAEGPTERMLEKRVQQLAIEMLIAGAKEEGLREKVEAERERLKASIEEDTRRWLLIEKIAEKEKIFTLEDDVDEKLREIARQHDTTPVRVREHYEEKELLPELRANILEQKVCTFLLKKAKITEKEGDDESPEEVGKEEAGSGD